MEKYWRSLAKKGGRITVSKDANWFFFHIITSPVWNQTVSGQPQNAVMHPKKKKDVCIHFYASKTSTCSDNVSRVHHLIIHAYFLLRHDTLLVFTLITLLIRFHWQATNLNVFKWYITSFGTLNSWIIKHAAHPIFYFWFGIQKTPWNKWYIMRPLVQNKTWVQALTKKLRALDEIYFRNTMNK